MFKNIVYTAIVIIIIASIAYYKGWLSPEGQKVYHEVGNTGMNVIKKGANVTKKALEKLAEEPTTQEQ